MSSTREKGISRRDSKGSRKADIKMKTEQGKGEEMQPENMIMPRRVVHSVDKEASRIRNSQWGSEIRKSWGCRVV